jgi:mono/diheme cytochrome c family protein
MNNCAQCHGSDARGSKGFPNLTDGDWLYGGTPDKILETLNKGRAGNMPPMAAAVGTPDDVRNVAQYVLSLSGGPHDSVKAALGKTKFAACAACHGADKPKDDLHKQVGAACGDCHQTTAWRPATFDHAAFFVLDRDHRARCVHDLWFLRPLLPEFLRLVFCGKIQTDATENLRLLAHCFVREFRDAQQSVRVDQV